MREASNVSTCQINFSPIDLFGSIENRGQHRLIYLVSDIFSQPGETLNDSHWTHVCFHALAYILHRLVLDQYCFTTDSLQSSLLFLYYQYA